MHARDFLINGHYELKEPFSGATYLRYDKPTNDWERKGMPPGFYIYEGGGIFAASNEEATFHSNKHSYSVEPNVVIPGLKLSMGEQHKYAVVGTSKFGLVHVSVYDDPTKAQESMGRSQDNFESMSTKGISWSITPMRKLTDGMYM